MSNLLKVGGRYLGDNNDPIYQGVTVTNGLMNPDGTITASTNYKYSNKIKVSEGEVISTATSNNAAIQIRAVAAFLNGSVITAKGWDPEGPTYDKYTVPSGVDEIIVTGALSFAKVVINNADGVALPFAVSSEGKILTSHVWKTDVIDITGDQQIRDTNNHSFPATTDSAIDVSGYAILSLRIYNSTNKKFVIGLYADYRDNLGAWMSNAEGTEVAIVVNKESGISMITPDDMPELNYIKYLRIYVRALEEPTSGTLNIKLMGKR